MTLKEALSIPMGMDFIEYEKLLKDREKLEKKIKTLSNKILIEEDSLEVLADEIGSERYNKHLEAKQKAEATRNKTIIRLNEILQKLK